MSGVGKAISVIWLVLLVAGAAFYVLATWPVISIADIAGFFAIVFLIYIQVLRVVPVFDLSIKKLRLWILNHAVQWSLDITFETASLDDPAALVSDILLMIEGSGLELSKLDKQDPASVKFVIQKAFHMEVYAQESADGVRVGLYMQDTNLGYRDSVNKLRKVVWPVVELVKNAVPSAELLSSKYSAVAHLGDQNPFYQHMTRELPENQFDQFAISAKLDKSDSRLSISKSEVSVVSSSWLEMQHHMARLFQVQTVFGV